MRKMSTISKAVKLALLSGAVAMPAIAAENVTEEKAVERIEVTGSRILREGAIAPSPVTVISGEELLGTGAINIGEVLNELPSLAPTFSLANSGRSIGTAGLNLLDLRGMGTSRTLVLVDGKRHVSSSAGSASVDVNTIPSAWVESVEIITGGASAVYGADAVTGVVNFKLKKHVEGFDFNVTKGWAEDNPYTNEKISSSFGFNFDDDKGNVAFAVEINNQNSINALDRSSTRTPYMSVNNPEDDDKTIDGVFTHDGVPDKITVANAGWYDSSTAGNFYLTGPTTWYIFNEDGSVREQDLGTTYGQWGRCSDCELLDLRRYTDLQPEFDRVNYNFKTNYQFSDDLNVYADAKYVRSKGSSKGQPSFFEYGSALEIQRDNAYVSPSLAKLMDEKGLDSISVHRFQEDAGRRFEKNTRTTSRFVVGAEGNINEDWNFDAYAVYGETKLEQVNINNLIRTNFQQSIDAVKDADGQIVCRDELARANGCVPTSIFGDNAINQQARDWFNTTSISSSKISQTVVAGSVTNSALFDLPAGAVGFATGVEYREEQSDSVPDSFAATGATFLNSLQEEHGKFDVKEVYAELSVPLLTDLPLIEDLTFDTAVRFADYSTVGNATSWKAGLDWQVTSELRVRSTYSEALRAPNVGELFGPQNQTFFTVTDPCGKDEVQDANRAANCAALGIPADFDPQATASSIEGLSGGNPDLKEESSESTTIGLVYQPEFLEGFSLTVDYWSIDITDSISSVSANDILEKCVDSSAGINNQFCALIKRNADSRELELITSITQNVAAQTAEGYDFEFGYDFDALNGSFQTKLVDTYLVLSS